MAKAKVKASIVSDMSVGGNFEIERTHMKDVTVEQVSTDGGSESLFNRRKSTCLSSDPLFSTDIMRSFSCCPPLRLPAPRSPKPVFVR